MRSRERGLLSVGSLETYAPIWQRFATWADRRWKVTAPADVSVELARESVLEVLTAQGLSPTPSVQHLRRTALRLLYRILRDTHVCDHDPARDIVVPRRRYHPLRPLTLEEVERCRWASLSSFVPDRRPAIWAAAECGARPAEIALLKVRSVDLDGGRLRIVGRQKLADRWAPLTEWAATQFSRLAEQPDVRTDDFIVDYGGGRGERGRIGLAQHTLRHVLLLAGLGEDELGPRSITGWVGNSVLERTGRIDEAARLLGYASLDQAAEAIGFDWRHLG